MKIENLIPAICLFVFTVLLSNCSMTEPDQRPETSTESMEKKEYAMVVHGGAGTLLRENMTPEKEKQYRAKLAEALKAGAAILEKGGSSADAVEAAIILMEDSPLFNAGKGAVFTNAGTNELDASFMDGKTRNAGAVGGVRKVKNPIQAARAVLEHSPHVLLTGKGADLFAKEQGIQVVDTGYFHTESRWNSLQRAKAKKATGWLSEDPDHKFGTVGAVALDKAGNIAAGTSTGGMTNKRYGRLGDSPIIAAGTYADNATCGVSSTGHGEFFIRYVVAYDVSAQMTYAGKTVNEAADYVINKTLTDAGGTGGIIALDNKGTVAMPFNTAGMYRGYIFPGEEPKTFIYGDEKD